MLQHPIPFDRSYGLGLIAIPLVLGTALLLGSWLWQRSQNRMLVTGQNEARICREIGQAIVDLRSQPRLVEDRVVDSHTLAGYLESSARKIGMNQNRIRAIHPEYPRRVPNSSYVETTTRVRLTQISLEEATRLVWNLQREAPGLAIPELRIWMEDSTANTWEAELDLIALAYSPMPSS